MNSDVTGFKGLMSRPLTGRNSGRRRSPQPGRRMSSAGLVVVSAEDHNPKCLFILVGTKEDLLSEEGETKNNIFGARGFW